jgi:hypothetical protein
VASQSLQNSGLLGHHAMQDYVRTPSIVGRVHMPMIFQ